MELLQGSEYHGFTVESIADVEEIEGRAYVLRHHTSGARLLFLQNEDVNKAFSISFRTPPRDDSGVFHILEHSVLCGSEKFPVKEPFVNLLKTSMQTFLNAMTFSDKTMYPVASTNMCDLLNLMDVYLDAVFCPAIYKKPEIFKQEGWHYELKDVCAHSDGQSGEQPDGLGVTDAGDYGKTAADESQHVARELVYNGVVYNEMKGALSDPSSVLFQKLQSALFPDTAYRFESGGTPQGIVKLTYEQFLSEHAAHYSADNSYMVVYGDADIEAMLALIDEGYLSESALARRNALRGQNAVAAIEARNLTVQKPVQSFGNKVDMVTSPENACMAFGSVITTADDCVRVVAADVVLDALAGSNEAPLKRALLDADLADDVTAYVADGVLQPAVVVQLQGLHEGASDRFVQELRRIVTQLLDEGLDHDLLRASIAHSEFLMREHDFGTADGVIYSIAAMSSWLYDDARPFDYLRFASIYNELKSLLDGPFFEDLLRSLFLDAPHAADVELVPCEAPKRSEEAKALSAIQAKLSEEDLRAIENDVATLRAVQEAPDSPEALATLPQLKLEDIAEGVARPSYAFHALPVPHVYHEVPTNGIMYASHYYSLANVYADEVPYVSILVLTLGKLDTLKHTAAQLDTLVQSKLGALDFKPEICGSIATAKNPALFLTIESSALEENREELADIPFEIALETVFDDAERIRNILLQQRVSMEQDFISAGHVSAMARLSSYYSLASVVAQKGSGVDFYQFLCELINNYDARYPELREKLIDLQSRIFVSSLRITGFSGAQECLDDYLTAVEKRAPEPMWVREALGDIADESTFEELRAALGISEGAYLAGVQPSVKNEAFITPGDVVYCAAGCNLYEKGVRESDVVRNKDISYDGSWAIVARILSFDYLWNEVRVKGGAYGTGFQPMRDATLRFYSYRDPHMSATFNRFAESAKWLASFNPTAEEFEGYLVSTVAGVDNPVKPRLLAKRQMIEYFSGYLPDDYQRRREEILAAQVQDIRTFASLIEAALQPNMRCVFGNADIIASEGTDLNVVKLF